ncbi:MetQ/NlpA family ABC transporter substrate-binding protein [Lentilactobacillus buchneri]|uniref:Lipoprotein n=1 Tax=Lentilactobacillus buchneri subsp. silagei CD034 TaxID=1071400 RepID=J9W4K3_LENBU|nr:MetQ/NlpA family ABC transporter substrate-binding protein [Lentilactobacillus buchneri]AFR99200.1 ABC superfamily ATP binding cassette transporter, methionine binding protein [Lentilactobacillus buchneri subsp. silagei CD034]MCT2900641.1 MetQ/NlpA family ABC transporter substrate-binding protein [Lentilactobacillus buchneri]MCT3542571.1 MetQ/NlpA family ABC transporter substrate-binding protein [Lentilactobacillus buchneri]MCT3545660.1 MetQ/NlpA family ABC transporter substrate-binding prot
MKKSIKYLIWVVVVIAIVVIGYFSFGRGNASQSKTVTIGVITGTKKDQAIWDSVSKTAKDKYHINIKLKNFTDYSQPNKALSSHNIDLNAFQSMNFLIQWNQAHKSHLTSIGKTLITPLRIYSKKYTSVNQIKSGSQIAIANDAANEARALELLQSAGLIKLDSSALPTVNSITSNPKKLRIKTVDANQTARALPDVGASVINGGFAVTAGIPEKYSIFKEPLQKQYVNVIVANNKDKNKKLYKEVIKAYQSAATKKEITKQYGDLILPAWDLKFSK